MELGNPRSWIPPKSSPESFQRNLEYPFIAWSFIRAQAAFSYIAPTDLDSFLSFQVETSQTVHGSPSEKTSGVKTLIGVIGLFARNGDAATLISAIVDRHHASCPRLVKSVPLFPPMTRRSSSRTRYRPFAHCDLSREMFQMRLSSLISRVLISPPRSTRMCSVLGFFSALCVWGQS